MLRSLICKVMKNPSLTDTFLPTHKKKKKNEMMLNSTPIHNFTLQLFKTSLIILVKIFMSVKFL